MLRGLQEDVRWSEWERVDVHFLLFQSFGISLKKEYLGLFWKSVSVTICFYLHVQMRIFFVLCN